MSMMTRSAYAKWPAYNQALVERVAVMSEEHLAIRPSIDRWPLWATLGHVACQRVSGLCGLLGEPGAETTPFPNALYRCPGDEYLEPSMNAAELAAALGSTFAITERCLDTWPIESLDEIVTREIGGEQWTGSRGAVIQRSFAHDVYHVAELNETLSANGLPLIDLWD
jgi:hypothetical protein